MELKDFKEKLEQKQKGMNIALTSAQRTFLFGTYYELTGRTANINCSSCDNKPVPNRYKNNKEWIKSKLSY